MGEHLMLQGCGKDDVATDAGSQQLGLDAPSATDVDLVDFLDADARLGQFDERGRGSARQSVDLPVQ